MSRRFAGGPRLVAFSSSSAVIGPVGQAICMPRCAEMRRDAPRCAEMRRPFLHPPRTLPTPFPHPSRTLFAPGQATYAAANAALDEILRGDAIRWGGWAGAGMAADHAIDPVAGEAFCSVEAKRRAAPPAGSSAS